MFRSRRDHFRCAKGLIWAEVKKKVPIKFYDGQELQHTVGEEVGNETKKINRQCGIKLGLIHLPVGDIYVYVCVCVCECVYSIASKRFLRSKHKQNSLFQDNSAT